MPGGPGVIAAYERVLATGADQKIEFQACGVWFDIILRPTVLPTGERGILGTAMDITLQKIALREQAHRTKNAFTMAMAMVSHTARGMDIPLEFKNKLHARLSALSKSQDAVSHYGGRGTTFLRLLESQMGHAINAEPERFEVPTNDCFIGVDLAQYVTLAIYELYTNAVKYGALSKDGGRLRISCSSKDGDLSLTWEETGVDLEPSESTGFGRRLVTEIIPKAAKGTATFDLKRGGLVWTFTAPQCASK